MSQADRLLFVLIVTVVLTLPANVEWANVEWVLSPVARSNAMAGSSATQPG
ncbi:MAG: hypothetical protein M3325_13900 [Actinomycetota bacterium]|nr:hypothetical protein [Actinomycetota bacterium]MDQ3906694.1 hypothetical protein [Actinomycetota bacterium]